MSISPQETSADRLERVLAQRREGVTTSQKFMGLLQYPLETCVGMLALFGCAFFNLSDLTVSGADKVSLDFQVLIKLMLLGAFGVYGGIGLLTHLKVRQMLFSFPIMWMVIILGFFVLSVPGSVTPKESLASTISIGCVLLGTTRALVEIGVRNILKTVFYAGAVFLFTSWLLFLFVPSLGVFQEPITEGQFVARMSGMSHPNTLGQFAGITIVIGLLLYRVYGEFSKFRAFIVLMAIGALLGSVSRSSLFATMVGVLVIYRASVFDRRYLIYLLWIGVLGCVGLMALSLVTDLGALIESKLATVSKSGDAEELTTATGRAEIWAYAIKLIAEEPLTGYGATTSKWYLSDYSLYTHNLLLNVAFSTGVFGGFACLCMIIGRVVSFFRVEHPVSDALIAFVVINGLFENVIFSILCGMPTIIWILALAATQLDLGAEDDPVVAGGEEGQLLGASQ